MLMASTTKVPLNLYRQPPASVRFEPLTREKQIRGSTRAVEEFILCDTDDSSSQEYA